MFSGYRTCRLQLELDSDTQSFDLQQDRRLSLDLRPVRQIWPVSCTSMEQWFTGRFPFELPGLTVVAYCYSTSARSIWLDTLLSVLNLVRIILVATQTRNANLVHFFDHGRTLSYRARTSAHNQACELLVLSHGKMRFRMVRVWQIIGLIAKKLCSGKLDWYYSLWPQQLFSCRASKQSLTWFIFQ